MTKLGRQFVSAMLVVVGATWACGNALAQQDVAGSVEFARGVGFVQTAGNAPQTLATGVQLRTGDRLTTLDSGTAIVRLQDGTRFTLRPSSEMVITEFRFAPDAADNSLLLDLVRGGFRALTGLISKTSSQAARVQTSTATIGIRGTDFDARLCAGDCAAESARAPAVSRPNAVLASARVLQVEGEVHVTGSDDQRRRLAEGGPVYPGDTLTTQEGARVVLAFRDEALASLGSRSQLRLDNFVYDEGNAAEGRLLASLVRGSLRLSPGRIAAANPNALAIHTALARITPQGGVEMNCNGACASESPGPDRGLLVHAASGSSAVAPTFDPAIHVLQAGQSLLLAPPAIQPLLAAPALDAPRLEGHAVPERLFASQEGAESDNGLFVFVRDGHIEIVTQTSNLHLGRGEAGLARINGSTARPRVVPRFMDFDRTPHPTARTSTVSSLLGMTQTVAALEQCR